MRAYFTDASRSLAVSAFCDRFLFTGTESYGTIVLLSVAGPHSAAKALLAAAATGYAIRTDALPNGHFTGGREGGGRIMTAPLSPGLVHGIYVGPDLLDRESSRFALLGETPQSVYRELNRRFTLPAVPEWADWIYAELKKLGRLKPLGGFGGSGSQLSLTEADLDALITEGVRRGDVRF